MSSQPTAAQESFDGGEIERRRSERRRIEELVYAAFGSGNGGFPINVSEHGMSFQGIQLLHKDQLIQARFKLPGTQEAVEGTGQVVWLNDLKKGGGLNFVELSEASRQIIRNWLSEGTQPTACETPHFMPFTPSVTKEIPSSATEQLVPPDSADRNIAPTDIATPILTEPESSPAASVTSSAESDIINDVLSVSAQYVEAEMPALIPATSSMLGELPSAGSEQFALPDVPEDLSAPTATVEIAADLPIPPETLPATSFTEPPVAELIQDRLAIETNPLLGTTPMEVTSSPTPPNKVLPQSKQLEVLDLPRSVDKASVLSAAVANLLARSEVLPGPTLLGASSDSKIALAAVKDSNPVPSARTKSKRSAGRRPWILVFGIGLVASVAFLAFEGGDSLNIDRDFLQNVIFGNSTHRPGTSAPLAVVPPSAAGTSTGETSDSNVSVPSPTTDADSGADTQTASVYAVELDPSEPDQPLETPRAAHRKITPSRNARTQLRTSANRGPLKAAGNPRTFSPAMAATPPATPEQPAPSEAFTLKPAPANSVVEPIRRGGNVVAAQLVFRKDPIYPEVAKAARFSGVVEVHFTIKRDGSVSDVTVDKGNPVLADAAVKAIRAWRYKPARRDGALVETEATTTIDFTLD